MFSIIRAHKDEILESAGTFVYRFICAMAVTFEVAVIATVAVLFML